MPTPLRLIRRPWLWVTLALFILPVSTVTGQTSQVVVLGTGTPNADPERSGPAVAVVVNDRAYLFDAGPGLVRRASAAQRAGVAALRQPNLDVVFLTHLHSDHTLGLPDLMFSPWVLERTAPLRVFGPPGTFGMVASLLSAYKEDIRVRLDGGEPSNKTGWKSEARDIEPGFVYRDSNVTVTAFAVPHGAWTHAFGYRIQTRDRVIVISGDTGPSEEIVQQCNGCDVLVHEVRSHEKLATRPPDWQRYHSAFHTSTLELGRLAERAKPKLLVLYHQLYWGASDDDLLREVRSVYSGPVVSAKDLGVY
jgi:ribonuclease BN (tRNA processing enzyme)